MNSKPNTKELLVGPRIWRINRLRYPGWVIPTKTVRWQVWHSTESWVHPIAAMASEYTTYEKLFAFRELNWRLEVVLFPMFSDFAEATEKLLEEIDVCNEGKVTLNFHEAVPKSQTDLPNLRKATFEYSTVDIRASWKELAFAILRFAREKRDLNLFEKWTNQINSGFSLSSDEISRICYEQSLWGFAHLDHVLVKNALREWPDETSIAWRMRHVSILLQAGEIEEAAKVARLCYERIQKIARSQHTNLSLVSIEAWNAMVLSRIQEQLRSPKGNPIFDAILLSNVKRRIKQLARLKYDPWQLLEQFRKISHLEAPTFESETKRIGFHPNENRTTYHFGQNRFERFQPAYEVIRFSEEAPFPPQFTGQNLCAHSIKAAAIWLIHYDPIRTDSILFHLKAEKLRQEYLSRHRVAAMSDDRLTDLYETAKSGLKEALKAPYSNPSSIEPKAVFLQTTIKTALDIISRLVIRMPQPEQVEILDLALRLYQMEYISRSRSACDPLSSLFRSLFLSLPESVLVEKFPEIAQLPIPGTKEFPVFNSHSWPHAVHEFSVAIKRLPNVNPSDWKKPIDKLLVQFDEGIPVVRDRALLRLDKFYGFECMTKSQIEKFGLIYWKEWMESGIPHHQPLQREACLALPAPDSIDIGSRFRDFVFNYDQNTKTEELVKLLGSWSYANQVARKPNHDRHTIVKWSEQDLQKVLSMVEIVWARLKATDDSALSHARRSAGWLGEATPEKMMQDILIALRNLIVAASDVFRDRLNTIVSQIDESRFAIGVVLPVISLIESDIEVENEMRYGLASHDRAAYVSCLSGLLYWSEYSGKKLLSASETLPSVPTDIVRELGVIVANRRQPDLDQALAATSMFIRSTTDSLDKRFLSSVLFGLSYLLHELDYSFVENKNLPFAYCDVPKLRKHAARIAVALKRFHAVDDEVVANWIDAAMNDPLPEIRKVAYELNDSSVGSVEETKTKTEGAFVFLKTIMRKRVAKKHLEYIQRLLSRIEIDIVEQQEADLKLVAMAVCNAAKHVLVSKSEVFDDFVAQLLPGFALQENRQGKIFNAARTDDCSSPQDTLDAIILAFEVNEGAKQPLTNSTTADSH